MATIGQYVIGGLLGAGLLGTALGTAYCSGKRSEEVVGITNSGSYIIPIDGKEGSQNSVVPTKVVRLKDGSYKTYVCESKDKECIPNDEFADQLKKRAELRGLQTQNRALEQRLTKEAGLKE